MEKIPKNLEIADKEFQIEGAMERLEAAGFDLTQLTPSEAHGLLISNEMRAPEYQDKNFKVYGKINNGTEKELSVSSINLGMVGTRFYVLYKEDLGNFNGYFQPRSMFASTSNANDKSLPVVEIKSITISGKNSLIVGDGEGRGSAEVSFLEIPEAYTKLMEKKEGKAE